MLADRLRMIKTESLPDFVDGYPITSTTYGSFGSPSSWVPQSGNKLIGSSVTQQQNIQLNYTSSSHYFYVENQSSQSATLRITGAADPYGQNFSMPAGKRWLFVRSGSVLGYPNYYIIEY